MKAMVLILTFLTREKGSPYSTTALTKLIQNEPGILLRGRKVWVAAILLFVFAFSVRAVISLNYEYQSRQVMTVLTDIYKMDARNLASGDLKTFLEGPNPPIDAHILSHPPGYPIFLATVFKVSGDSDTAIKLLQTAADSLAVVLIFFLALQFFPFTASVAGAAFVAFSPQLSMHSQSLLPESLSVLPIIAAMLCVAIFLKKENLWLMVVAGLLIGLSCWLRSTSLFFAPFMGVIIVVMRGRKCLLPVGTMLAAMIVTIAPITTRNFVVFHEFIPLSLGSGVTLLGGIADYDKDRRFGLPRSDVEVAQTEAVEFGNPAYGGSLYNPDGILREKYRRDRGVQVIRENPVWFAGVMARRAVSMLEPERVPPVAPSVEFDEQSPASAKFVGRMMWWPQKIIYAPAIILAFIVIGLVVALIATDRRWLILLALPVYALLIQSMLHTEPRYTLGIWYFLLIFAGVGVAAIAKRISRLISARSELVSNCF